MSDAPFPSPAQSDWCSRMLFVQVFKGFRYAMQPGKLFLAVSALALIGLAIWLLDGLWPNSARVVVEPADQTAVMRDELEFVAESPAVFSPPPALDVFRSRIREDIKQQLTELFQMKPFDYGELQAQAVAVNDDVLEKELEVYPERLEQAGKAIERRYEKARKLTRQNYQNRLDRADDEQRRQLLAAREREMQSLQAARDHLIHILVQPQTDDSHLNEWIDRVIVRDESLRSHARIADAELIKQIKENIRAVHQLAQIRLYAEALEGRGIGRAFYGFILNRFDRMISSLFLELDLRQTQNAFVDMIQAKMWLFHTRPVYAIVLSIVWLAVWGVFGGAICRMTALQMSRDERIGPVKALSFALGKFSNLFFAPLVPLLIIAVICLVVALISLLGAIPALGEIITSVLLGLALLAGFIVTLVLIGLTAGFPLMYPTIAVEGSDSFDAISRAFSYVFSQPWRAAFYAILAALYGMICYLFVRLFAFLVLGFMHAAVGATVNLDGSAFLGLRGKLDAIWPAPEFMDLYPQVAWFSLNATEKLGAFFVGIWLLIVTGIVIGFLVSFFFSVSTIIYGLLRYKVDATDIEDVYLEEDVEDLVGEQQASEAPEPPAAPGGEASTPPPPADSSDTADSGEPSESSPDSTDNAGPSGEQSEDESDENRQ